MVHPSSLLHLLSQKRKKTSIMIDLQRVYKGLYNYKGNASRRSNGPNFGRSPRRRWIQASLAVRSGFPYRFSPEKKITSDEQLLIRRLQHSAQPDAAPCSPSPSPSLTLPTVVLSLMHPLQQTPRDDTSSMRAQQRCLRWVAEARMATLIGVVSTTNTPTKDRYIVCISRY